MGARLHQLVAVLGLCASSCTEGAEPIPSVPGPLLPTEVVGPGATSPIVPGGNTFRLDSAELTVGGTDAPPPLAFGRVTGGVTDPQGRLWVSDGMSGQVTRIEPGGAYTVVGHRGQGPGEYVQPRVVGWRGIDVIVVDEELGRITLINSENDSVATHRIEPPLWRGSPRFIAGLGPNGEYVFVPYYSGYRRSGEGLDPKKPEWVPLSPVMLAVQNPLDTGVVLFAEPIADIYFDGESYRRDPTSHAWDAGVVGDTVVLAGASQGDLLISDISGSSRLALNMSARPGVEVTVTVGERIESYLEGLPEDLANRLAPVEALTKRGFPRVMPFFDRLVVAQDGAIWLRRKEDTFGGVDVRWEVLSPSGYQLGTALVRAQEEVLAAGGGWVATLSSDALGAAVLRMYRHPFVR